jgi:error-prone DNA polymerase
MAFIEEQEVIEEILTQPSHVNSGPLTLMSCVRYADAIGDDEPGRYAGSVICRQRPGTASGVVFMTLEAETGVVNVAAWSRVFEEHVVLVKTSSFLGVTGRVQKRDGVVHVIAESFWDPQSLLGAKPASGGSRDFH